MPSRSALRQANKEWARQATLFKKNERSTRLALCFYLEELEYRKKLRDVLVYKADLQSRLSSEESGVLFANTQTLLALSSILTRDLHGRFCEWRATDSIVDVFLIAVQGLRCYASYYSNYEVLLPITMARLKQKGEFVSAVNIVRPKHRLGELAVLLKCPLERIDSVRKEKGFVFCLYFEKIQSIVFSALF